MPLITIVSSFHNEESSVAAFVIYLEELLSQATDASVVLVDNGSTDATWLELGQAFGARPSIRLIQNPLASGWGDGVRKALDFVTTDYVMVFPSDMQYPVEDVKKVLSVFKNQIQESTRSRHFAIFSNRVDRRDAFLGRVRGALWRRLLKNMFKSGVPDLVSQLRIFPARAIPVRDLPSDFLFDVGFHLRWEKLGLDFVTVEVGFQDRPFGESSSGGYWRSSLVALGRVVRFWRSNR